MTEQPRGRPPGAASPPIARGRNALTALGGGVLVLAVAGGAWVLFGRQSDHGTETAIGPAVSTSAPAKPVIGPVAPPAAKKPTVSATALGPAVPSKAAAPAATAAATMPPAAAPTKAPAKAPAAVAPATAAVPPSAAVPATSTRGTVAQKAYTFRVAQGDTLWRYTVRVLTDTGRSTSNATVASFVSTLYAHNSTAIGSNPNLIVPGETITWPAGV